MLLGAPNKIWRSLPGRSFITTGRYAKSHTSFYFVVMNAVMSQLIYFMKLHFPTYAYSMF